MVSSVYVALQWAFSPTAPISCLRNQGRVLGHEDDSKAVNSGGGLGGSSAHYWISRPIAGMQDLNRQESASEWAVVFKIKLYRTSMGVQDQAGVVTHWRLPDPTPDAV